MVSLVDSLCAAEREREGFGLRAQCSGSRSGASGLGFRVMGVGLSVQDSGSMSLKRGSNVGLFGIVGFMFVAHGHRFGIFRLLTGSGLGF